MEDGRIGWRSTQESEVLMGGECWKQQGGSVEVGRSGHSSAVATPYGGVPFTEGEKHQSYRSIDRRIQIFKNV